MARGAPPVRRIFAWAIVGASGATSSYAGPKLRGALVSLGRWTLQIIKRSDAATGFEVLP